jgi:hypothetical protein
MPDNIAKIGLDTADMARALDRISGQLDKQLAGSARHADEKVSKLGSSIRNLGRAMLGAAGIGGIGQMAASFKRLNSDIEETRSHLVAGSAEAKAFDKTLSDSGGKDALVAVKQVSDWNDRALTRARLGIVNFLNRIRKGPKQGIPEDDGKEEIAAKKTLGVIVDIQKTEDEIAVMRSKTTHTMEHQLKIMDKEIKLDELRLQHASEGPAKDRVAINAQLEKLGLLKAAALAMRQQIKDSENLAKVDRSIIIEKRTTNSKALESLRIQLDYHKRINEEILKSGAESERVELLRTERDNAIKQAKANQKRETTRERIEAMKDARRLTTDAKKQDARDAALDAAILRGAKGTPNSRLEERRRRNNEFNAQQRQNEVKAAPEMVLWGLMVKHLISIDRNSRGNLVVKTN